MAPSPNELVLVDFVELSQVTVLSRVSNLVWEYAIDDINRSPDVSSLVSSLSTLVPRRAPVC